MSSRFFRRKPISLLIFATLAFLVCFPLIFPVGKVAAQTQSQYINRDFCWNYGGETWTWNLSIPTQLYDAYDSVPDSVRTQIALSGFGYFTTTEDCYMQELAAKINATATEQGYSQIQEINFALAFVQSIPYATDFNSTGYQDYPRFPVQTLVDDIGDCKSHSILFATLTLILGYGAVFINPPDHLAVGVLGNNLQGTYWTYDNQTYYYCETTGEGFTIGQLPTQFDGQGAYVYPIDTSQQYVVNYQSSSTGESNPVNQPYNPNEPEATPTSLPNTLPSVSQPTAVPVQPISLNLISDNPALFTVIVIAIGLCLILAIKPIKFGKSKLAPQQTTPSQTSTAQMVVPSGQKYCIYCGTNNKSYALFCENCGKQIAEK